MTKQMTKIALMLVLMVGLMASAAMAQKELAPAGYFTGVETDQAICEAISANCYGNVFVLDSFGDKETLHLTLSLNYLDMPNHNGSGYGIIGGSWSLMVYRNGEFAGRLRGKVSAGSLVVRESKSGDQTKDAQLDLLSTGGSGIFEGKEGENISGIYSAVTDMRSGETKGKVYFAF